LKTRIISGIVGLILLGAVVFSGSVVLGIGIFILSLLGIFEFYNAISNVGYKPVKTVGYISCISILVLGLNSVSFSSANRFGDYIGLLKSTTYISLGLFVIMAVLVSYIIFKHEKYNIIDISLTVFGVFYVTFLFSFVVLTRNMDNGFYLLWFIFIGAFVTDTFAYFSGRFFGKKKILPDISPKKTLEGAIGGIIGCVLITYIYGIFINSVFADKGLPPIEAYHFIIMGIINGLISQVGDWAASAIKRFSKVKDYGKIMPGHGGVLDRFDSILFVAPAVYLYLTLIVF
jgi:phosphatidate cytidylyltransferase